jgi:hypothetical protein
VPNGTVGRGRREARSKIPFAFTPPPGTLDVGSKIAVVHFGTVLEICLFIDRTMPKVRRTRMKKIRRNK